MVSSLQNITNLSSVRPLTWIVMPLCLQCSAEVDENMKAVVKMIHDECVSESEVPVGKWKMVKF